MAVSSKKSKIELLYGTAIPLLGICLKKLKTRCQKDICTPIFLASHYYSKMPEAVNIIKEQVLFSFVGFWSSAPRSGGPVGLGLW